MTEQEMSNCVGKSLFLKLDNGKEMKGECIYFTKALDNEPEVPSISFRCEDGRILEIDEPEIKQVQVL